jgi:hypothetical protein
MMVADQPEDLVLRKDCGLVVDGAVAKVKGQAGCDAVSVADLN